MTPTRTNGHTQGRRRRKVHGLMAVLGMLIGALGAWAWLWVTPPAVPMDDYVLVVAAAYARERLPLNAVDRLTAAGVRDPALAAESVAVVYKQRYPERRQDIAYLDQLATALKPQSAISTGGELGGSGTWWPWLGSMLLIIAAAGVAALLVARSRRSPPANPDWQVLPNADEPTLQKEELVGGMRTPLPAERIKGEPPLQVPSIELPPSVPGAVRLSTVAGQRRRLVLRPFVCTYHIGEEPFEDVHPIIHEDGSELIGAVGLTAAARLGTVSPTRYYAFSAWLHDYLTGQPMLAVGLLSPWASGRKPTTLYDPALTQASLQRTEKGLSASMKTSNLMVTIEVTDVGYGIARDVPANSYFTILSVRFGVTING